MEERRRAQEEAAEKEWIDGQDDELEGQEETAEEREESIKVQTRCRLLFFCCGLHVCTFSGHHDGW